jgi:hypothetical protein
MGIVIVKELIIGGTTMNELSPEVQGAIIMSASQASIEFAKLKIESKKGKKNFNQVYAEAFEKNYDKLICIVNKPEASTPA